MLFKVFSFFCFFLSSTQAMLSDGIHEAQDYVDFVETQEAFKATCFVYDHYRHILQTGVLITPDIVMTTAHGLKGNIHLEGIIVGFGDTISHEGEHNYKVKKLRSHPRYYTTQYPMQAKYDLVFLKLTKPVKGVKPVPLFSEKEFNQVPPLYVATFGSADIPRGTPVRRRAFVLPESDIFSISGRDPEALYDFKTVMMGSIFFEPNEDLKPAKINSPEKEWRTYQANKEWQKLNKPPYAMTLPGSSGAPVFINITEDGKPKTYVFGLIQSYSHLSDSNFRHSNSDLETRRILKGKRWKLYGHYQSVFCIPYKLYQPLQAYRDHPKTYRLSKHVKKILAELDASVTKEKRAVPKKILDSIPPRTAAPAA